MQSETQFELSERAHGDAMVMQSKMVESLQTGSGLARAADE